MVKKPKKRPVLVFCAVFIVSAALVCLFNPAGRAKAFAALHGDRIEASLQAGLGIPAIPGVLSSDSWEGAHCMAEFTLFAIGSAYYGCYYSPDDVPLPFQNADVPLHPTGQACWAWAAEGDNRGMTRKIRDKWYYFEAHF